MSGNLERKKQDEAGVGWGTDRISLPGLPEKLDRVCFVRGFDGSSYCPRYLGQLTLGSVLPATDPIYHLGAQRLGWPREVSPGSECRPGHGYYLIYNKINIYNFNVFRHMTRESPLVRLLWGLQMVRLIPTKNQGKVSK